MTDRKFRRRKKYWPNLHAAVKYSYNKSAARDTKEANIRQTLF